MAGELELKTEMRPLEGRQFAVVSVTGDVDLATADLLVAELAADACRASDGVVLDLSAVPFMDSSGLRAVLVSVEELECRLAAVVVPDSAIARLLDLTGVNGRLPSYTSAEEALAALAQDDAPSGQGGG